MRIEPVKFPAALLQDSESFLDLARLERMVELGREFRESRRIERKRNMTVNIEIMSLLFNHIHQSKQAMGCMVHWSESDYSHCSRPSFCF